MRASFEVTTVNRLAARKLLTVCGVKPEHARVMSLRALQEHLDNLISLGNLSSSDVIAGLTQPTAEHQAMGTNSAPNNGAPWTSAMDQELAEHFRRGQTINQMAMLRGRTAGGIQARLEKLGLVAPSGNWIRTSPGFRPPPQSNARTVAGAFASPEQIAEMDSDVTGNRADLAIVDDPAIKAPSAAGPVEATSGEAVAGVDAFARDLIVKLSHRVSATERVTAKIATELAGMAQTIADTVKAEVERTRGAYQRFEIVTPTGISRAEGLAHKAFPKLLRAIAARTRHDKGALNIWLYGPAGTGKSTAARKVAEHLNLDFHTNGPVGSQWDIRGFTDAQGKVVETAFRRAWINGGVYCWDEGDGSAPAALIEANGALATGFASFPDGVFKRHADCIVIINGNLRPGAAPDATYNGRYKQDTAFVNRFVAIEWGIDEDLERALLGQLNSVGEQWLKFIRGLRRKIAERGIKGIVVSPRQAQYGLALIDAGAELDEVMEQTVKFMFTDDQWKVVAT